MLCVLRNRRRNFYLFLSASWWLRHCLGTSWYWLNDWIKWWTYPATKFDLHQPADLLPKCPGLHLPPCKQSFKSPYDPTKTGQDRGPLLVITQSLLPLTTFSILDPSLYLAQPPWNAMLWAFACILLLSSCTVSFFCTWHVMAAGQSALLTYPPWLLESGPSFWCSPVSQGTGLKCPLNKLFPGSKLELYSLAKLTLNPDIWYFNGSFPSLFTLVSWPEKWVYSVYSLI